MIRVLAVDDDQEFIEKLSQFFYNTNINIADYANDGLEAVKKIKNNKYDIILLDLIMPNRDGLYVLEYMKDNHRDDNVIIITSNRSTMTISEVTSYNVDYYMLKPCDYHDLENKINNIFKRKTNTKSIDIRYNKISNIVMHTLHELGLPSSLNGYKYIKDSILYLYFDDTITGFSNNLYQKQNIHSIRDISIHLQQM